MNFTIRRSPRHQSKWYIVKFISPDIQSFRNQAQEALLDQTGAGRRQITPSLCFAKAHEATREHYTKFYALPGAMRSAFAQFRSIRQDAEGNKASMVMKLGMPVLAIGGEKSFGTNEAIVMRNAATDVTEVVIPNAGHWLMDEQPEATIAAVRTISTGSEAHKSSAREGCLA
ncbi:alpha/beta fold hydrolase [Mesorhizobium newzealandense]|uniref:Alpha/beta fold hydrolase n=1 Tax=Mesorhizobium newzealandense TaxID=1300302 RepID=A0ABW4UFR4_9HYPH